MPIWTELWHVKSRDRMAFHRHAIRHQRQGKLTHQLYGRHLAGELYIKLTDRESLAA